MGWHSTIFKKVEQIFCSLFPICDVYSMSVEWRSKRCDEKNGKLKVAIKSCDKKNDDLKVAIKRMTI